MTKNQKHITMKRREFLKASVLTAGVAATLDKAGNAFEEPTGEEVTQDLASSSSEVRLAPHIMTPSMPVIHDPEVCIGCNTCVDVCHQGIMVPNPEKGKPPIIVWPEECWPCGLCVQFCPLGLEAKAITQNHPINQRVRWKRKATGEHFRLGMPDPPAPNMRPPVGGWKAQS